MSDDQPYESPSLLPAVEPSSPPTPQPAVFRVWPSILSPFAAIVLAGILQVVLIVGLVISGQVGAESFDAFIGMLTNPPVFLSMLVAGQVAFAITAVAAGYLSPEPMRQRLAFPPRPAPTKIYLLTMLGSIFVLAIAIGAAYAMTLLFAPDESLEQLFENMTVGWAIPFVILIGVLPGFFEEIFFRGYIQTRFLKRWSPPVAIGASAILFGIAHITPHAVALATIFGFWFGYVAWRTGSIGPGILCHFFVNFGLNLWRMIVKFAEVSETIQWVVTVVAVVIGLGCFLLAIRELQKLAPPNGPSLEMARGSS